MSLNKATGNMYDFVTHTWNPIQGRCLHDCSYCYMKAMRKRFPNLDKPIHLNGKELETNLGSGNVIFVGSSTDMFADDVPLVWIEEVIEHCEKYPDNKYIFQSKNVYNLYDSLYKSAISDVVLVATLETNRKKYQKYSGGNDFSDRIQNIRYVNEYFETMITVEPIMDFDYLFIDWLIWASLPQVNIGADSGNNNLPEPPAWKVGVLIDALEKSGIKVYQKNNLKKILDKDS